MFSMVTDAPCGLSLQMVKWDPEAEWTISQTQNLTPRGSGAISWHRLR